MTLLRKGGQPEVLGKTETIWGFHKISLIICNFFDLISKQVIQCKSRTLEPVWTEGTMTVQVDEALEEVVLSSTLTPFLMNAGNFVILKKKNKSFLAKIGCYRIYPFFSLPTFPGYNSTILN